MPPPRIFRILLPARDLAASARFYERLLATPGRAVAPGRFYFDCGPVILGILDYSSRPRRERPRPAEAIYLATEDLAAVFDRAVRLGCLSRELLHGDPTSPLGRIRVRPWGERSFYVDDPAGNALCFVDARTLFRGTRRQVAALSRAAHPRPKTRAGRARRPTATRSGLSDKSE